MRSGGQLGLIRFAAPEEGGRPDEGPVGRLLPMARLMRLAAGSGMAPVLFGKPAAEGAKNRGEADEGFRGERFGRTKSNCTPQEGHRDKQSMCRCERDRGAQAHPAG